MYLETSIISYYFTFKCLRYFIVDLLVSVDTSRCRAILTKDTRITRGSYEFTGIQIGITQITRVPSRANTAQHNRAEILNLLINIQFRSQNFKLGFA